MQAKMAYEGDCVVVHLSGRLDVETAVPFRRACLESLADKKVVFSFKELSFVGSSGILPFLETMQEFMQVNPNGFRFCHVGSEFKKVLMATALGNVGFFDNEVLAAQSFREAARSEMTMAGIVPVPKHTPRAITEGINPIFLNTPEVSEEDLPEADENLSDAEEI